MSKKSTKQIKKLDIEEIASAQKQHEFIDRQRTTQGLDLDKIKQDAKELFELRRMLGNSNKMNEFRNIANEKYAYFSKKFPQFLRNIEIEELDRIDESLTIMNQLFDKLNLVNSGIITHTQLRNTTFEQDLAQKYYKRK